MKALVTGGSGFIGHNLTLELSRLGWGVVVIDNLSTGSKHNKVDGVEYYYESIVDNDFVCGLVSTHKPEVVFHLAAVPRVSYSVDYPYETAIENVLGTVSLLDAVRKNCPTARVISSSSSSVCGDAKQMPTPESYPCDPKSPYALEKWQLEQWCRMYAHMYNMDIAILRYFNVFGPFSLYGGAYSTVLSAWMYSLFVDTSVVPYLEGTGEQSRDFCFVDNVIQANLLAAASDHQFTGHIFNVAQGERHTLLQVKSMLEEMSGQTIDLERRPPRPGDIEHTLADISHATNILHYKPQKDFKAQVQSMVDWYRDSYPKNE